MSSFAEGLRLAQESFGCHLIGGDTDMTPGPLTIGVTIIGSVPAGTFVRRQGAARGDHVFVTGTIGDSALGLAIHSNASAFATLSADERAYLVGRYLRPAPRLGLAEALRTHASAALDISDGLLKDLSRLAGPFGLSLEFGRVPLSEAAKQALAHDPDVVQAVLGGGDDYELLVAVPHQSITAFRHGAEAAGIRVSDIGTLDADFPLSVIDDGGTPIEIRRLGYDHFSR
jgi:thiamine-monophosphate kinase